MNFLILFTVVVTAPTAESAVHLLIADIAAVVFKKHPHHLRQFVGFATVKQVEIVLNALRVVFEHGIEIVFFELYQIGCRSPVVVVVVHLLAYLEVSIEVDAQFLRLGFLACDDNYTVGSAGAIDRGCRSIFENGDVFNIVGVDGVHAALDGESVDNNERRLLGVEGAFASDGDSIFILGVGFRVENHAWHPAFEVRSDVAGVTLVHILCPYYLVGTGGVFTLDVLIARHDYFLHHVGDRFHHNADIIVIFINPDLFCLHADVGKHQCRLRLVTKQGEIAVHVS